MGLQKSIVARYGLEVKYWKVVQINIGLLNKESHVVMFGWRSKAERDAWPNSEQVATREYDWIGDESPFLPGQDIVETAEDKIISLTTTDEDGNVIPGEFADAIKI